ncbi:hypothetical protein SOVF_004430 [Spinacia oleracea]|nr:hypothetical protein SOVF_004430 [Spinacia oleracea]
MEEVESYKICLTKMKSKDEQFNSFRHEEAHFPTASSLKFSLSSQSILPPPLPFYLTDGATSGLVSPASNSNLKTGKSPPLSTTSLGSSPLKNSPLLILMGLRRNLRFMKFVAEMSKKSG